MNKDSQYIKNNFSISIDEVNKCFLIYLLLYLLRNPANFGFTVASSVSSVKPLSKLISSILKLMFKQIKSYNNKCQSFGGINTLWTVRNEEPVI